MPWSNQGGGPWGSGPKGPWGGGPQSSGPTPPDLEDILRRGQDKLRSVMPGNLGGKGFAIVKDDETIVIAVAIADKELLIEMAPDIYYQTDHYVGWPSLPLRAAAIGDEELKQRLIDAWRFRAPSKQRAIFDQRPR